MAAELATTASASAGAAPAHGSALSLTPMRPAGSPGTRSRDVPNQLLDMSMLTLVLQHALPDDLLVCACVCKLWARAICGTEKLGSTAARLAPTDVQHRVWRHAFRVPLPYLFGRQLMAEWHADAGAGKWRGDVGLPQLPLAVLSCVPDILQDLALTYGGPQQQPPKPADRTASSTAAITPNPTAPNGAPAGGAGGVSAAASAPATPVAALDAVLITVSDPNAKSPIPTAARANAQCDDKTSAPDGAAGDQKTQLLQQKAAIEYACRRHYPPLRSVLPSVSVAEQVRAERLNDMDVRAYALCRTWVSSHAFHALDTIPEWTAHALDRAFVYASLDPRHPHSVVPGPLDNPLKPLLRSVGPTVNGETIADGRTLLWPPKCADVSAVEPRSNTHSVFLGRMPPPELLVDATHFGGVRPCRDALLQLRDKVRRAMTPVVEARRANVQNVRRAEAYARDLPKLDCVQAVAGRWVLFVSACLLAAFLALLATRLSQRSVDLVTSDTGDGDGIISSPSWNVVFAPLLAATGLLALWFVVLWVSTVCVWPVVTEHRVAPLADGHYAGAAEVPRATVLWLEIWLVSRVWTVCFTASACWLVVGLYWRTTAVADADTAVPSYAALLFPLAITMLALGTAFLFLGCSYWGWDGASEFLDIVTRWQGRASNAGSYYQPQRWRSFYGMYHFMAVVLLPLGVWLLVVALKLDGTIGDGTRWAAVWTPVWFLLGPVMPACLWAYSTRDHHQDRQPQVLVELLLTLWLPLLLFNILLVLWLDGVTSLGATTHDGAWVVVAIPLYVLLCCCGVQQCRGAYAATRTWCNGGDDTYRDVCPCLTAAGVDADCAQCCGDCFDCVDRGRCRRCLDSFQRWIR